MVKRKIESKWIGFGIAIGVAIGAGMNNVGAGIAIGVALGIGIAHRKAKQDEVEK